MAFKYEIKENLGTLSNESDNWVKELNLLSWNNREPKYDIRVWNSETREMGKGISLSFNEVKKLSKILQKIVSA